MPTGVEEIIAGIGGALAFIQSIAGEAWTRYFVILSFLALSNVIGFFTGIYILESLISFVISSIFGIEGFSFPNYYGLSSLLVLAIIAPLVFYVLNAYASTEH